MSDRSLCCGFNRSGYWKDYPCGATPTVRAYGGTWCANHIPLSAAEAEAVAEDWRTIRGRLQEHGKDADGLVRYETVDLDGEPRRMAMAGEGAST